MSERRKKPIAQEAYDQLAEAYAALIDTKPHNAYYERPATLSLLPDVQGLRVLDAGCGPGAYAEWLVKHGAQVVAIDGNENMVRLAKERLGDAADVLLANLEEPLSFLTGSSFDIVLCPLAMDYVWDWEPTFIEFHRILKAGGILVFSMEHPHPKFELHRENCNYFNTELVEYTWRGFGKPVNVPSYRRPLSEVINPLLQSGFILEQILEPMPTPEFKQAAPQDYEELSHSPGFLCVKAVKK